MSIPRPSRPTISSLASFQGWRAFQHRNYRLFFVGQLISLIGTWMTSVAQSWLILQLTGNPFDLGLVTVFQFGPVLFLGLSEFGGSAEPSRDFDRRPQILQRRHLEHP